MMQLAGARRRADEFARAVDGPVTLTVADEHRVFLELVEQLRAVEGPTMRPEFSADLRSRLLEAAPAALSETTPAQGRDATLVSFPARHRRRTASAAAAACLVVATGVGVAAASQSALPGDALYPLKRGIEQAQLHFAGSQGDRGSELLEQASTRLSEATELSVGHAGDPTTPALVTKTLNDFIQESTAGGETLLSAYRDDQDAGSIVRLREFTAESERQLEVLASTIPDEASQALADAASTMSRLDQQAQAVCPPCSTLPSLQLSSAMNDLQNQVGVSSSGAGSSAGDLAPARGAKSGSTAGDPSAGSVGTPGAAVTLPGVTVDVEPSNGVPASDPEPTSGQTQGGTLPSLPVGTGQPSAPSVPLPSVSIPLPLPTVTSLSVPLPPVLGEATAPLGPADLP